MRKRDNRPHQIYEKILSELVSKTEIMRIARKAKIPLQVVKELIDTGKLIAINGKYLPADLDRLIKNYNLLY